MPNPTAQTQTNRYAALNEELKRTAENRPNHHETMDLHQNLQKLFAQSSHRVEPLAFWHWDDVQSTHVVTTPLTYPTGRNVAAAISPHTEKQGLLVQATFTTGPRGQSPTPLLENLCGQTGTEYQTRREDGETHHIVFDIAADTAGLISAVNRVTQAAAAIAAVLAAN